MSPQTPSIVPSWLLKAKVTAPEPTAGHVARNALMERLDAVLERRFAALQAPAGFGKSTVLADFCRRKREQGLVAGWLSLDEDDAPALFGSYLAYALESAGLDLSVLSDLDGWSSSPVTYQIGMLARAIDLHAAPCVIALDEVDRLPGESVELIQRLVEHGPANLHLAPAFRSNPGLDLTMQVFDGSGTVVGAREFLFSRAEIADFFRGALSRRQLIEVEELTGGWPVALMVYRNAQRGGGPAAETAKLTAEFVRVRLMRGLSEEDRRFVCELAVFDWIDADLVDEVLGTSDARLRIAALTPLDGLMEPLGEDGLRRLHPLVRDYCADLLAMEDAARKRSLEGRLARTLARRGQLIAAWRHARSSGDGRLVGELVERAGVFEMWLRHGVTTLVSAAGLLSPGTAAPYPRLELLRSIVLRMSLKVDEAVELCERVASQTDGFTRDREGGDDDALAVDGAFARIVLAGISLRPLRDEIDTLLPAAGASDGDGSGRFRLGAHHLLLCGSHYEQASLDECRRHAALARGYFGDERPYGAIILDIYRGMAAMAQGRVEDAAECYARVRRGVRRDFPTDPCLAVCADAVTIELDLERGRERAVEPRTLKNLAALRAVWTDVDAAAVAVAAELTLEQHAARDVIELLTGTLEGVRATRSDSLSRCVAGLLVFYLAELGRPDEAARVWREERLPDEAEALLDLDGQPWRTMESMACARVRLLAGQGQVGAAEELADRLCSVAAEHGLLRSRLRGLALSMAVAERAGETDRALTRLVEFLRSTRNAGYVRPLARDPELSRVVLERLLAADGGGDARDAAASVLDRLSAPKPDTPVFSQRELQVLAEVRQGLLNREIAVRLGISQPGVRFHLANIYRKTGVNRRDEAVRSAQSLGFLD